MGTDLSRILKVSTGKLNIMQMMKEKKYGNVRFYIRVDMMRSARKSCYYS